MPFRFPLQAVLRFRESFERRECQRLQALTREAVKARQEYADAKQERATAHDGFAKALGQGMTGVELQFELACDRTRLRRLAALAEKVVKLEDLRVRQLAEFRKARQQLRILEELRKGQLATYRLDQDRHVQQQLDEMFLIQHGHDSR